MFENMNKKSKIEEEIDEILNHMKELDPTGDDYEKLLKRLERLMALNSKNKEKRGVNPETWANGAISLVQIGMILGHEKAHVITSKAMNFVRRGKF